MFASCKQTLNWPGLFHKLPEHVTNDQTCVKFINNKCKPPTSQSLRYEVLLILWSKLAMDLFYFENSIYLLNVGYYLSFPVVHKLNCMIAKHVTSHMQRILADHGCSETFVFDNGLCCAALKEKGACHKLTTWPPIQWACRKNVHFGNSLLIKWRKQVNSHIFNDGAQKCPAWQCGQLPMGLLYGHKTRSDLPLSCKNKD